MTLEEFSDEYGDSGALLADGFEAAFAGPVHVFTKEGPSVVASYDYERCIEVLLQRDDFTYESAEEFMQFNVLGAYMGRYTPVYRL